MLGGKLQGKNRQKPKHRRESRVTLKLIVKEESTDWSQVAEDGVQWLSVLDTFTFLKGGEFLIKSRASLGSFRMLCRRTYFIGNGLSAKVFKSTASPDLKNISFFAFLRFCSTGFMV